MAVALGASRFGALEAPLFGSDATLPAASEVIPTVLLAALVFDVLILLPEAVAFRAGFAQLYRTRITGAARTDGRSPEAPTAGARDAT